jgi:salicylate synthase
VPNRRKYHERVLAPVADPLAVVVSIAARQPDRDYVCYEGPDGWSFAADPVAEVIADRHSILLRDSRGETRQPWSTESLHAIPELLDTVDLEAWRAYGWSGFELAAAKDGLLDLVGEDPFLHLMIPRTEIRFLQSSTVLRAVDAAALDTLQDSLAYPPEHYRAEPVPIGGTGAEEYQRTVRSAIDQIVSGRLRKVILSRTVPVSFPVDLVGTYAVGRRANSPARSFLLSMAGLGAAGFSPETVVEVTQGVVGVQPLAGTRARSGSRELDAALRQDLLTDSKEVFEHAISVQATFDDVANVCLPGTTRIDEFMAVKERGSVQHLASSVRGTLSAGVGSWDAFAALYPAVTASGVPKSSSYEVISELEETLRGLYAGAVLTFDSDGSLDAALVLRTVFQRENRSWLRAGAGIVEQSRPEREFTETCEKLQSVARYLVPREPVT